MSALLVDLSLDADAIREMRCEVTMTITINKCVSFENEINASVHISSLDADSEELPFVQELSKRIKSFANSYPNANAIKGGAK